MRKFFLSAILFLLSPVCFATVYTLSNGSIVNQVSSLNYASGDTILIPAGTNVSVNASYTFPLPLVLMIAGNLNMSSSNKILTLPATSKLVLAPNATITGQPSTQIIIGTTAVFNGGTNLTGGSTGQTLTGGTPLALHLQSFNVLLQQDGQVAIQWTAQNDGAVGAFQIEISADGKSWQSAELVAGKGGEHELVNYNVTLNTPAQSGTFLYRLHYVSPTGTEDFYSATKAVRMAQAGNNVDVHVAANMGVVSVWAEGFSGNAKLYVRSIDGKIISATSFNGSAQQVEVPGNGMYVITVSDDQNFSVSKKVTLP